MTAYHLEHARRQLALRDPAGALAACERAVAEEGGADAWSLKASIELMLQRPRDAAASIARAIALAPGEAKFRVLAGNAAEDVGDPEAARAAYEEAARLAPEWAVPWTRLGTLRLARGESAEAAVAFEKAVAGDPSSARAWNNLGLARLESRDLADAEVALRRALEIQPDHPQAFRNLARALGAKGDAEGARRLDLIGRRLQGGA